MGLQLNKVLIAGNLTRDPEVRFLANETAVAKFGLASNKTFRKQDGTKGEMTTFVDIECWGRIAELAGQYLSKGRPCLIEGSLELDQWEDNNGNKRSKLKIRADMLHFLGSPDGQRDGGRDDRQDSAPAAPSVPPPIDDDEVPF